MAGITLGFLKFVLGFDSIAFSKGATQADADLKKLQKSFAAQGKKFTNIGKDLSIGISLPLAALASHGIEQARQTAAAMAQVNASLASMGPVAGKTAEQLRKAADVFEGSSLFEADDILKNVTATMLTFGNITGAVFDKAQQAAVDLATKFGKGLPEAALLVGKALNDPIAGLSALTRVGVQFTDQQKEQIKAMVEVGNVAGAQAVILAELNRQVGGSAAAAQAADPWNKLKDAFNQVAETVGNALIPIIPVLANALTTVANAFTSLSPETQKWVIILGGAVAVLGPILVALGSLITVVSAAAPLVSALATAWTVLKAGFLAVRIAALATLPALTPFLIPLGAIALAVGAVYLAWKNWDKIAPIVQKMVSAVTAFLGKLLAPFKWVIGKVDEVNQAFFRLYDRVVGHSYIPDLVVGVRDWIAKLQPWMVAPIQKAVAAATAAFAAMPDVVPAVPNDPSSAYFPGAVDEFGKGADQLAKDAAEAKRRVIEEFGQMAAGVVGSLKDMVTSFKSGDILGGIQQLLDVVLNVIQALGKIGAISLPGGTVDGTRAAGGPVVPGKTYLVGERGPEFVTPRRSGFVHPNGSGGAQRVVIVPSPYFNAVVDNRASNVAAPMAGRAAVMGAGGAEMRAAQRQRRNILAA